ncbi:MAG: hypothetical protein EBY30_17530, partial [Rhodospirillales bacterium]|nr:hypothetical protein [Rhodospirillales bacterium]
MRRWSITFQVRVIAMRPRLVQTGIMKESNSSPLPTWLASAHGSSRRGLAAAAALAITGCASPVRLAAVPRGSSGQATVLGVPNERFRMENG